MINSNPILETRSRKGFHVQEVQETQDLQGGSSLAPQPEGISGLGRSVGLVT